MPFKRPRFILSLVLPATLLLAQGAMGASEKQKPDAEKLLSHVETVISGAFDTEQQKLERLQDVLRQAYLHNPSLRVARARLNAIEEDLAQAHAGWQPTVEAAGNITSADTTGSNFGGAKGTTSKEVELGFNQPLFRGGSTVAAISGTKDKIAAERALLIATEQQILRDVATAYMDVVRDQALLRLSRNNESVIETQLEATQDRFDVGELTRTDVSQAESRLARAQAETIRAAGDLQTSRAVYEQIVGMPPGNPGYPDIEFSFPEGVDMVARMAENNNPEVRAAAYYHESSQEEIDRVFGELLPTLDFFGNWNRQYDPQPGITQETTTKTVGLSATIPLYQGGAVHSRVRQARHTANQRYLEILEVQRQIRQQAITNWENLQAAQAEIKSRQAQVEAAEIAKEGVHAEAELGSRTILDALDADQELMDAQVALTTAKRDEIVARFALAATLGVLTPEKLGFPEAAKLQN